MIEPLACTRRETGPINSYDANVLRTQFLRALNGLVTYPHPMDRGSHHGLSKRNVVGEGTSTTR
jgi:hypothetical protein